MTEYNIVNEVIKFRTAMKIILAKSQLYEFRKFKYFPKGCCVLSSHLLARHLVRNLGYEKTKIVRGYSSGWHYWILADTQVFDITSDQFEDISEIIIGESKWHNQIKISDEWIITNNFFDVNEGSDRADKLILESVFNLIIGSLDDTKT